MSQSRRTAVMDAARQTLERPPSSLAVDWMAAALNQMAVPVLLPGPNFEPGFFEALGTLPTALLGLSV